MGRRRISDVERVYRAVTKSKGMQKVKPLPKEIQEKFRSKLEGIQLPKDSKQRKGCLDIVTNILDKKFQLLDEHNLLSGLSEDVSYLIEDDLYFIATAVGLASKSSKPLDYMCFMARPVDYERFFSSANIFLGDRKIAFEEVPEEKKSRADKIIKLISDDSEEALRELLEITKEYVTYSKLDKAYAYFIAAFVWNDEGKVLEIFRNEASELYQKYVEDMKMVSEITHGTAVSEIDNFEFKIRRSDAHDFFEDHGFYPYDMGEKFPKLIPISKQFRVDGLKGCVVAEPEILYRGGVDGMAKIDSMIIASDSTTLIQHELQHLFDALIFNLCIYYSKPVQDEYRAYLASIAFSENPAAVYRELYDTSLVEFMKKKTSISEPLSESHYEARLKIKREIERLLIQEEAGMEATARINGEEILSEKLRTTILKVAEEAYDGKISSEKLRTVVLKLLNEAYKNEVGLTYDEILEPFKKE